MLLKITPKQRVKINALVRRSCCNYFKGHCLLLDDGEEAKCMQLISRYLELPSLARQHNYREETRKGVAVEYVPNALPA